MDAEELEQVRAENMRLWAWLTNAADGLASALKEPDDIQRATDLRRVLHDLRAVLDADHP